MRDPFRWMEENDPADLMLLFIFCDVEGNVDEGFFGTKIMVNVEHPNDEAFLSGVNHSSISWPIAR
jgi:hypothetical protein